MMSAPTQIAHYTITGKLGEGGMGDVYKATDTKLHREVAIKVVPDSLAADPDRLLRFTREAQILAGLNHPNIATIYGVEERAIVMELVEGSPLAGPMTPSQALPILHQLIDALEYAHDRGVVHRDLKPANILFSSDGRLKVLDFGLAKALASEPSTNVNPANSPTLTMNGTQAGLIMGTAAYMAPEQARGNPVDKRCDIWAFGVIVYELVTGKRLFGDSENVSDILAAVLRQEIDFKPVPPVFERLVRMCLTRDPRQRLRDISGARLLLEERIPEPAATSTAYKWISVAAVVAAAIAIGAAWRATRPVLAPLIRLTVDLGPEAVSKTRNFFALAPDGRRIAYTARSPEGKQSIAVRQLDQAKVELLTGTENASDPVFSPDGEWIAFFADGQLKKVAVAGGAPTLLASPALNPRGISWAGDGSLILAPGPLSGLFRVPSGGGAMAVVTTPSAKGQATHRWPQVLPGGQAVLFTSHTNSVRLDEAGISVLNLKTGEWKTVQEGGYFGRYVPTGHLLFVRLGTLFAVRFDLDKLETSGAPIPMLADVAANRVAAAGRFDFVPYNGTLAYVSGQADGVANRTVWLEKTGKSTPAPAAGVISSDGRLIAAARGAIDSEDIRVWDIARDVSTSITTDGQRNRTPVWAPDNKHLVYASNNKGVHILWWARADGGQQPVKLMESKTSITPSSFSPDGRSIAIIQESIGTSTDIWILPIDLSNPEKPSAGAARPFLEGRASESRPRFSPDGKWIAYISDESSVAELHVRPYPGPGGRWVLGPADWTGARWSQAGKQLFFPTMEGRVMVCDYEIRGDAFLAAKPRLWTETRVESSLGSPSFDVSPDGQRLLTSVDPAATAAVPPAVQVTFLLHFFDELKRRLP